METLKLEVGKWYEVYEPRRVNLMKRPTQVLIVSRTGNSFEGDNGWIYDITGIPEKLTHPMYYLAREIENPV